MGTYTAVLDLGAYNNKLGNVKDFEPRLCFILTINLNTYTNINSFFKNNITANYS